MGKKNGTTDVVHEKHHLVKFKRDFRKNSKFLLIISSNKQFPVNNKVVENFHLVKFKLLDKQISVNNKFE